METSSVSRGSRWATLCLLLPALAPLFSRLAYVFPDRPFRRQIQVGLAAGVGRCGLDKDLGLDIVLTSFCKLARLASAVMCAQRIMFLVCGPWLSPHTHPRQMLCLLQGVTLGC